MTSNFSDQFHYLGSHRGNLTMTCLKIPPPINSLGILDPGGDFLTYALPLLELQIGLIFIFSYTIHCIIKPFGASLLVSCLLAGVFLGPTFLGRFEVVKTRMFPQESQDAITTLSLFGFNLLFFLSAVKIDVGLVLRTGHKALSIGIFSVVVPLLFGLAFENLLAVSSFYITAYMIGHQFKISDSELGRLSLSSSIVAESLGTSATILLSLVKTGSDVRPIIGFLLFVGFVFSPAMYWISSQTPERKPVDDSYVYIIMAIAISSQAVFSSRQLQFLVPFIMGLAVPSGSPLGSALVEKFEPFTLDVLFQILTATSMMRADLWLVVSEYDKVKEYVGSICGGCTIKLASSLISALFAKLPLSDALAISVIMNYWGIVELNWAILYRDTHVISEECLSLIALSILLNATISPLLVKRLYDPSRKYAGYQGSNVMSLKLYSDLKILACIHRPDNIGSIMRLIDASCPTKNHRIGLYVLHLVNVIGLCAPVLISHSKDKAISSSSTQNVIIAFDQYDRKNGDRVSIQIFTAMSTYELMHEDIYNLALDERSSLILIPLHFIWSSHVNVSENKHLRTLNCKVLDKAPCSVGIFFDRGGFKRQDAAVPTSDSPFRSACMLFFGGKDDREALALGKRMARGSNTRLTVVHFIPKETIIESEDKMVDTVLLDDIKQRSNRDDEHIDYVEHSVTDGHDTMVIIHKIVQEYDLFLVGRRHEMACPQTSGLTEWSEIPELGIIGDFFASRDLKTRASILVVQQQKQIKTL